MSLIHGITTDGYSRGEAAYVNGHALAVDTSGASGAPQSPLVGGAAQAMVAVTTTGSNLLMGFRATVGAGDATVASEALAAGYPNTVQSGDDSVISFNTTTGITRLDVVGINEGAQEGGSNSMLYTGTAANALAEMITFTFATAVNKVVISATPKTSSSLGVQISVEGYTYA